MSSAGQRLDAGRVPGERIATTIRTASSAGITTTETVIDTVVASLVSGRTYRIRHYTKPQSTVADGYVRCRIREDALAGTTLTLSQMPIIIASQGMILMTEVEYTAVATGSKTFVFTFVRNAGTGTVSTFAAADSPTYFYVDYIRG